MSKTTAGLGVKGFLFLAVGTVVVVGGLYTYTLYNPYEVSHPQIPEEMYDCAKCHTDMVPKEDYFVHAVLGNCQTCHTAHALGESSELVKPRQELCLSCHPNRSEQGDYTHQPYDSNCLSCHDAHQSPFPAILAQEERDLCTTCHASVDVAANPVQHEPFAESCVSCHPPHYSKEKKLLDTASPELCYQCHSGTEGELAKRVQHEPFFEGSCLECHEVHSSPIVGAALLVEEERSLCMSCHAGTASFNGPVAHKPFDEGCVTCHEPHAAYVDDLLAQSKPGLCYTCHTDTRQDFQMKSSHPVASGKLNCNSCHSGAHTGNNRSLLLATGNSLCSSCHGGLTTRMQTTAHKGMNCSFCHTSHGSPQLSLLKRTEDANCTTCHDQKKGTYMSGGTLFRNHPTGVTGSMGQTIYCATCHDFHGPSSPNILRYDGRDKLCINCHSLESLWMYY